MKGRYDIAMLTVNLWALYDLRLLLLFQILPLVTNTVLTIKPTSPNSAGPAARAIIARYTCKSSRITFASQAFCCSLDLPHFESASDDFLGAEA